MYEQEEDFVTVLKTSDEAMIAVARSLLEGSGIRYFVKNFTLQGFAGANALGALVGNMEVQVSPKDADSAVELLADLLPEPAPFQPETEMPESTGFWLKFFFLAVPTGVLLYFFVKELVEYYHG